MFVVSEADKPYVPPSCCLKNQWDDYINLEKCQTWIRGPPGKQSGDANEALHYRVCRPLSPIYVVAKSTILTRMSDCVYIGHCQLQTAIAHIHDSQQVSNNTHNKPVHLINSPVGFDINKR